MQYLWGVAQAMRKEEIRRLLNNPTKEELRKYHGTAQWGVTTDYLKDFIAKEFGIMPSQCIDYGDDRCLDANTARELILAVLEVLEE